MCCTTMIYLIDFVLTVLACGGHVNNLGGGITMMHMVQEGTKLFDCVWIIKPPETYLHRKTHLYVKIIAFQDFGKDKTYFVLVVEK